MPRTIRHSLIVLAILGLGAAGYAGFWFYAAGEMRENFERWAEERRAEGFEVSYDGLAIVGFPFRLAAMFAKPRLAAPHSPNRWNGQWTWRGARVAAWAWPWRLRRARVAMAGPQTLEFTPQGETVPTRITFADATGLVGFDSVGQIEGARLRIVAIDVVGGVWRGTRIKELVGTYLRLARGAEAPAGNDARRAEAEFGLAADGVELGSGIQAPLGPRIDRLAAEATIIGVIGPGPVKAALAAWRDAGGTIEVKRISLRWAALRLDAAGTVALDAELRPIGALKARVKGFNETLDALTASRLVKSAEAKIAKVVLGLMAKISAGGGREIEVPLTAQDGMLYAGPIALMVMPRIVGE